MQLYELNLRDYCNIFLKRKFLIIISFLVVFLSIFTYTNLQTPVYSASVLVKIDQSLNIPEMIFPSNMRYRMGGEAETNLADCTRQIISRPVLEMAAKSLGLIKDGIPDSEKNEVISAISVKVTAAEIDKTSMIRLQVSSKDPQSAADLANKIAEAFKKMSREQKNQQAYNVRAFIEKTLEDISKKLREQDERLRDLTMRGAVGTGVNIVNQIYELEKKRDDLMTRFTKRHPEVVQLDQQIVETKGTLKSLPKEEFEYGILKRDITIDEALYTNLKQKLPEAQIKEAEKVDNVLIINPAITPRAPSYPDKGKNYAAGIVLGLVLGVAMALITENIDTSIGRVEDIENFIKVSVLGVIPFCSRKDESTHGGKGRWGKLPGAFIKYLKRGPFAKAKNRKDIKCEVLISALDQSSRSIFLEAFRILSINIQVLFGKGEKIRNKAILITSCNPEEGKSIVSCNLAMIMAQMGYRTLLIDADSRRANVHKIFGLKTKEGGLLDILMGKAEFDSVIRTATDIMLGETDAGQVIDRPWLNNLNILTAGAVFPNPANLFNSEKMDELLNHCRKRYDLVIMDTSPVLAVSEPSILMPKVDGVLLVYKAGSTSRLALRRAKIQVESIKGPGSLSGIILNNVMPEVGVDTYYYYNKRYYGEKEIPAEAKEKNV
ncbi:MAG: AAA family ATPase [Candidatus Omnitrophica bacterium]|nr:AAA family ATPase [Candidatus Omnitrophota bacterium]